MIEITLKELNNSYQSLLSVSRSITGAPLKFRLLPVVRYAKQAIEDLNQSLSEIAGRNGAKILGEGQFTFADIPIDEREKAVQGFNKEAARFLKSETVRFNTDKAKYLLSDVTKCEAADKPTNAEDLAALDWLFTFDVPEAKEEEKAAQASA
jgi:hypothetical protein